MIAKTYLRTLVAMWRERHIEERNAWLRKESVLKGSRRAQSIAQGKALRAALDVLQAPPVDPDAARYRRFFDAGLPITFRGVEYEDKASLDAAIDRDMAQEGKAS